MTDPLDDRLAALGDSPVPPLPGAADVRRRGDRRRARTRAALGGGAAVVLLLAGGGAYAALSGPATSERLVVADPSPSATYQECGPVADCQPPTRSPAPSPSPRCSLRPDVPEEGRYDYCLSPDPHPTATPGQATAPPPAADCPAGPPAPCDDTGSPSPSPSAEAVQTVTEGVLTVADAQAAEPGAWVRSGYADEGPVLDPCPGGTRYPRDADRTADASTELTAQREAGGTSVLQQVARYPSPAIAEDAAAGYVRAVRGCPSATDEGTTVTYEVEGSATVGGVATTYVRRAATTGDGYTGSAEHYAVQQLGDVVSVVVVGHGEDGDPGRKVVEPFAREVAERLQRTVTG